MKNKTYDIYISSDRPALNALKTKQRRIALVDALQDLGHHPQVIEGQYNGVSEQSYRLKGVSLGSTANQIIKIAAALDQESILLVETLKHTKLASLYYLSGAYAKTLEAIGYFKEEREKPSDGRDYSFNIKNKTYSYVV